MANQTTLRVGRIDRVKLAELVQVAEEDGKAHLPCLVDTGEEPPVVSIGDGEYGGKTVRVDFSWLEVKQ